MHHQQAVGELGLLQRLLRLMQLLLLTHLLLLLLGKVDKHLPRDVGIAQIRKACPGVNTKLGGNI